jgi:Tol biopolymer transport system component
MSSGIMAGDVRAYIYGLKYNAMKDLVSRGRIWAATLVSLITLGTALAQGTKSPDNESLRYPQEKHLKNLRQLTFGGDNAEAYWSFDGTKLIFQATREEWGAECDQIYMMDTRKKVKADKVPPRISTGQGRTTCSYFLPGDKSIVYASTHEAGASCPPAPGRSVDGKYVWPIFASFDIYTANLKGKILKKLTVEPGYDAEATVSPKGDKIVFTSMRSGDLELYTMNLDGSDVRQITHDLGYDGGAFFSPDGSQIVFRASRPKSEEDVALYKDLLAKNLVQPTNMEIFVCNVDGSNLRQVTNLGKANWAPFFHPSGKKILFSSNHMSDRGYQFNLFMINLDGTGLEQVTFDGVFDSFPMFSPDGKKLAFSSNRNNGGTRSTNLFIADWVD